MVRREEPSASDASRRPPGTRRSTTSEVRVTVGSMRTESASAPAKPFWPNVRTMTAKMNSPATIEGIALMVSTINRTGRARRPPTSFRNTAVATPRGTDMSTASPTCSSVPTMAWAPPPSVALLNEPV